MIGTDAFSKVQPGVNAADAGADVNVLAGVYDEAVKVDHPITLNGAGKGITSLIQGLSITATPVGNLRVILSDLSVLAATDSNLDGSLTATPISYGIRINATGGDTAPITFQNLQVRSPQVQLVAGINVVYGASILVTPNNHTIDDVVMDAVTANDSYSHGVYVLNSGAFTTGTLSNLNILGSTFDTNNAKGQPMSGAGGRNGYGLFVTAPTPPNSSSPSLIVDHVNVSNSSFSGNFLKGIYVEALSNATFTNVTVQDNANLPAIANFGPAGVDINLKYGNYQNIVFESSTISNNANANLTTGIGLSIRARNDAPTYSGIPASLSGVMVNTTSITNSPHDLTLANQIVMSSVSFSGTTLSGTGSGLQVFGVNAGQSLNLGDTSFAASLATTIEDLLPSVGATAFGVLIHAEQAKFGGVIGNELTNSQAFAASAKIIDSLDADPLGVGSVYLRTNQLFVNPGVGNLPRGIVSARVGDRVHVNTGTYTENLVVTKLIALEGEVGTLLRVANGTGITVSVPTGQVELTRLQVTPSIGMGDIGINATADGTLHLEDMAISGFTNASLSFVSPGGIGVLYLAGINHFDTPILIHSGVLAGNGVLTGGVTVDSGATIAPGPLPGILQVDTAQLATGSALKLQISGEAVSTGYTQLDVTGSVDLTGVGLLLEIDPAFVPSYGAQFILVKGAAANTITGEFQGRPEGSHVSINGIDSTLSYHGGPAGYSVTLTTLNQPVFSELMDQTITYGTNFVIFSGLLTAGSVVPVGDFVQVTLAGVEQSALIASDGAFSTSFTTSSIGVAGSPYHVGYVYMAHGSFLGAVGSSQLTVNARTLHITADNAAKTYGDTLSFAGTEFTTGDGELVNGDTVSSVTFTSLGAASTATVAGSPYAITPSAGVGTGLDNYAINYDRATIGLTVEKADARIHITPYTVTFDGRSHTATGTATGVPGIPVSLSNLLDLTHTAHINAGTTIDTWTFAGNGNYNAASGTVTDVITKASASIQVSGYSGIYDGLAHGATGTVTGVGGINLIASLNLGPKFTNYPGGTTSWTFSGGANYANASGRVSIDIRKAPLTITANDAKRQYSDPNPSFSVSYGGFKNRQTLATSGVSGSPIFTTSANNLSPVGSYVITPGQGTLFANNYAFTFASGHLTVTQEDARVTYNGAQYVPVASATSTTGRIVLSALIKDIKSVPADPAYDAFAGNIGTAAVGFYIVETKTWVPASVSLTTSSGQTVARATATVTLAATSAMAGSSYTIRTIVGRNASGTGPAGNYTRDDAGDNAVVTLAIPASASITAGGDLINTRPSGAYAGDVGSVTNFGLNLKYNATRTIIRGSLNVINRSHGHVYQIKSDLISSINIQTQGTAGAPIYKVSLAGRAIVTDITNPDSPILLASNVPLHVQMTDNSAPLAVDTIAITLNQNGIEQRINTGNIQVRPSQLLDGPAGPGAPAGTTITTSQVKHLAVAAIARWKKAGITTDQLKAIKAQKYIVDNMPAGELGWQNGTTIALDSDASGYGWFVDPTPNNDSEFVGRRGRGPARGGVDLLTVIMHEMGHVLGLSENDVDAGTIMNETLGAGVRRSPQTVRIARRPAVGGTKAI